MRQKVRAVTDSKVILIKQGGDYGKRIYLLHADGHYSMYAHLQCICVSEGDELSKGDTIGTMGQTGYCPNGAHLHYSLFPVNSKSLYAKDTCDPTDYLEENGYPCDTIVTNPYGSDICNPKLKCHEGIDFSSWRLRK